MHVGVPNPKPVDGNWLSISIACLPGRCELTNVIAFITMRSEDSGANRQANPCPAESPQMLVLPDHKAPAPGGRHRVVER